MLLQYCTRLWRSKAPPIQSIHFIYWYMSFEPSQRSNLKFKTGVSTSQSFNRRTETCFSLQQFDELLSLRKEEWFALISIIILLRRDFNPGPLEWQATALTTKPPLTSLSSWTLAIPQQCPWILSTHQRRYFTKKTNDIQEKLVCRHNLPIPMTFSSASTNVLWYLNSMHLLLLNWTLFTSYDESNKYTITITINRCSVICWFYAFIPLQAKQAGR